MGVTGDRELERTFLNLSRIEIKDAVWNGIEAVRRKAIVLCPRDTGELQQSIFTTVQESDGIVTGYCYTNKAYAMYIEFGTGPKGQQNHVGISPDIAVSYTQSPWWIHESMIDKRIAEKYHWFYVDTKAGRFYQCTGQPAQPFMYPALRDSKEQILKGIKADFIASIKDLLR